MLATQQYSDNGKGEQTDDDQRDEPNIGFGNKRESDRYEVGRRAVSHSDTKPGYALTVWKISNREDLAWEVPVRLDTGVGWRHARDCCSNRSCAVDLQSHVFWLGAEVLAAQIECESASDFIGINNVRFKLVEMNVAGGYYPQLARNSVVLSIDIDGHEVSSRFYIG